MSAYMPFQCFWCKHLTTNELGWYICPAFKDGKIPEEIWSNLGQSFDHRYPHPEDNGTQFVKLDSDLLLLRSEFENNTTEQIDADLKEVEDWLDRVATNRKTS